MGPRRLFDLMKDDRMQVTETLNEGLKRGYQITVTAAELNDKVNSKLEEARPEVQMKGFRKGKVPMALLKKQFGKSILGEALQETIDSAINGHFEESGDRPAMQPDVKMQDGENWDETKDVVVDVTYERLPEIPETDFSPVKLERLVVEIEDAAVQEALDNLASTAKDFATKKGKAAKGDQVVFDFKGSVDGELFDGGSAEDYPLELGSGQFIPGFEDQLIGTKAGEEKDVTVTFPEEYGAAHLAGKEAVFACTIKEVKKPVAAEVNDDLAKKFGAESLEALKEQISERLGSEYQAASRQVLKRRLMDELDTLVSFDLPPSLVEAEANQIAHQLWHEENPDHKGHDHGDITPSDDHMKLAERRVRLGLFLAEIGQKAEIKVEEKELQQAIFQQARQYPGQEQAYFEFIQKNRQAMQQIQAPLFEDKVIDHIVDQVQISEKTVSKEELEKEIENLEDM